VVSNPGDQNPRRVGDATRQRIDELADGWDVPSGAPLEASSPGAPAARRSKPRTAPPPPPGQKRPARASALGSAPSRPRKPSTAPPPLPPVARRKRRSSPPPPPASTAQAPGAPRPKGDASRADGPRVAASGTGVEPSRPDATELSSPPNFDIAASQVGHEDPTVAAPPSAALLAHDTDAFRKDDATVLQDQGLVDVAPPRVGARPRAAATGLPRQRGLLGDVRYAFVALFGIARSKRELADTRARLEAETDERNDRLIAVARFAIGEPDVVFKPVIEARERLVDIEERRSKHAGRLAAADEHDQHLRRKRADAYEAFAAAESSLREQADDLDKRLGPLEQRAAGIRKELAGLERSAGQLAGRIEREERGIHSVKNRDNAAEIQAKLASLKAERESVLAQEPPLVAELEQLEPAIASHQADRDAARAELERRAREDADDQVRTDEKLAAAAARRQVEERAVNESDAARDQVLLGLGEWLDVERPEVIGPRLRGADEHAMAIATLDRRILELQELVDGIDRWAIARGFALVALAVGGAVAAALYWLL